MIENIEPCELPVKGQIDMKAEYWHCVIGPIKRDKLPTGADLPMRAAVVQKFYELGQTHGKNCWSGWGVAESDAEIYNDVINNYNQVKKLKECSFIELVDFWRKLKSNK